MADVLAPNRFATSNWRHERGQVLPIHLINDEYKRHSLKNCPEPSLPVVELIQSIPGVGFISAASLMSEIGVFAAFGKPKQLVAYFGLDPTVKESGKFKATRTRLSKRGSRIARRVLFRVVLACIRNKKNGEATNPVIKAYFDAKILQKSKKTAIGAIMRKITNVLFAVLRNNEPFKLIAPDQHCHEHNKDLKLVA